MQKETIAWQKNLLNLIDRLIRQVQPEAVKEMKWRKASNPVGVPVWSYKGIICTGETYKDKVKLTFFKGSSLADKTNLFNAGAGIRRAIDLYEADKLDEKAFKKLIQAAVELNGSSK